MVQSPDTSRGVLEEFFAETAVPLDFAIRSIVVCPGCGRGPLLRVARKHTTLTAKQTRFLGLLQNHIARFGSIRSIACMSNLHGRGRDGLDGVFEKSEESTIFSTSSWSSRPAERQ